MRAVSGSPSLDSLRSAFGNLSPPAPDYATLARQRAADLEITFRDGRYYRYIWPWDCLGITLLILYMLAPPNTSRTYVNIRYPLYAFAVYQSIRAFVFCRSASPPAAYGIGIINSFALAWFAFHLIWRDTRTQSLALAWTDVGDTPLSEAKDETQDGSDSGSASTARVAESDKTQLRHRTDAFATQFMQSQEIKEPYRNVSSRSTDRGTSMSKSKAQSRNNGSDAKLHPQRQYYWQGLPEQLLPRTSWIMTMILSLRGEGTTHGVASLPSFPAHIISSLQLNSPAIPKPAFITEPRTPLKHFPTVSATTRYFGLLFIRTYLLTDLAKNLIAHDPFFTGLVSIDDAIPEPFITAHIPNALRKIIAFACHDPTLIRIIRLALSATSMLSILTFLTTVFPLFFLGLLNARPESSLYPSVFGANYLSIMASTGLAGIWSLWWHQMFRLSLSAPHEPLCKYLRISTSSGPGKVLGLLIAFAISAAIHAAGSTTNLGASRPWAGSAAFFAVQPVGILLEMAVKMGVKRSGISSVLPRGMGKVLRVVWVHAWFFYTAPLFATDVARGGVWLTEPVPVSIVGGLTGKGWVKWEAWMLPQMVWGASWWERGIAL